MLQKKTLKRSNPSYTEFLEYRKSLSDSDKRIEAGLLVEEIQAVNVDNAFINVIRRIHRKGRKSRSFIIITRIAAVFALPLLAFSLWSLLYMDKTADLAKSAITWQEIQSPSGMRSHLILPDSTDLWLNAGSKIRYGVPFIRENREIELTGEAYLRVSKNEKAPFIVKSENIDIQVLGTEFNVSAYPEEKKVKVSLKEGRLRFYITESDGRKVCTELIPNDHLVFNKKTNKVSKVNKNIDKYISWHQNIMIFDDTPMTEVASTLERWYGIKVVIADEEIRKYKFTTTFKNEPLFRVMELFELSSPISIKYTPEKIDKTTNTAEQSVITITKD